MKALYKISLLCLLALPVISFSQVSYWKTFDHSFSGGNNGAFTGNMATDVVPTINAVDGLMDVVVNKVGAPWSVMWYFMGNCWTKDLVLDQTNRYYEFRVKCNVAQTVAMKVGPWGSQVGACKAQVKTWTNPSFKIPEADVWTIVLLKQPATTGGSQNVIDTITNGIAWELNNGNYSFDYVKMGIAAIPPTPVIDAVKGKTVADNAGVQNINLSGIAIPNRFIDGLTIKAEPLSDGIIKDVTILDLGDGPFSVDLLTNIATAALQFTPVAGMGGQGDSIIITLKDTIRGTTVKTSFYVKLLEGDALADVANDISVYPTIVDDIVNVNLPAAVTGEINVVDMIGNVVASQKVTAITTAKLNLSALASGIYIIKISDGLSVISKKIVKQ